MIHGHDVEALKSAPLFSGYGESEFQTLLRLCRYLDVEEQYTVFRENDTCSAIYFLVEGLIELSRLTPAEKPQVVEFVKPGQTFAEAAMFSGQGYPVTATALMDSRLIAVNAVGFMRLLQNNIHVTWKVLGNLSMRLHQLVGVISRMNLGRAEQRIAAYLLDYCEESGDSATVTHLPNRRKELANRVGLSVETLCRVLAQFRERGWIETQGSSRIWIHDEDALRRLLKKP